MPKPQMEILVGVPGSGKSTYSRKLVYEDKSWVRVSRDDCREMLTSMYYPGQAYETLVDTMCDAATDAALKKGLNVVLDNTHCNSATLKDTIKRWSNKADVRIKMIGSELALEQIKKQNDSRAKKVPEDVIDRMHNSYKHIKSHKGEYDQLIIDCATIQEPIQTKLNQDPSKTRAIIVDVDGTIAHMNDSRGPFDWSKVGLDTPDKHVLSLIRTLMAKYDVIFVSGRDESCRAQTEEWIDTHLGAKYTSLHMRPQGNYEKDSIVKERIFNEHIRDNYYIEAVFDDRDQVVAMWRNLGLKCLQVDYGSF